MHDRTPQQYEHRPSASAWYALGLMEALLAPQILQYAPLQTCGLQYQRFSRIGLPLQKHLPQATHEPIRRGIAPEDSR